MVNIAFATPLHGLRTLSLAYTATCHVRELDNLRQIYDHGPGIDTRFHSVYDRLTTPVQQKKYADDMIYGLIRIESIKRVGIFPVEISPGRSTVQSQVLFGNINHKASAFRYRLVNPVNKINSGRQEWWSRSA